MILYLQSQAKISPVIAQNFKIPITKLVILSLNAFLLNATNVRKKGHVASNYPHKAQYRYYKLSGEQ